MSSKLKEEHNSVQDDPSNANPPSFDANDAIDASDASEEQPDTQDATHPTNTTSPVPQAKKQNAFERIMTSSQTGMFKRVKLTPSPKKPSQHLNKPGRNGLGAYLRNPASFSSDVVVYHNSSFVVIRDKFPKSSVHLLLLPCTERNTLHPFFAFQDEALLAATRAEAQKVKVLVGEELRRLFGKGSVAERARREAIASGAEGEIPPGRDWESEVVVGVHSGPSMNHLHVHVLSRDMVSPCVKHRKHYNSFKTGFFVGLEELPLEEGDSRWQKDRGGGLDEELRCWRCGKGFERFEKLKKHLAEEFEQWKIQ